MRFAPLLMLAVPAKTFVGKGPSRSIATWAQAMNDDALSSSSTEGAAFEEALRRMTNEQLRLHLKRRGLKSSGNKQELIGRALTQWERADRPRRSMPVVELNEPPAAERYVMDGLLRDEMEVEQTPAYVTSTRQAWRNTGGDRTKCGVVIVAPGVEQTGLQSFADSIAFVCNAITIATTCANGAPACATWLRRERRAESIGLVAMSNAQVDDETWNAIVLWRPDSTDCFRTAAQPVLAIFDAASPRAALEADKLLRANPNCADYLVRALSGLGHSHIQDLPRPNDEDEAILLCTAWFDLHLGRPSGAKTAGPRTSQIWIDDRP